mmetsp:Transcript_37359/g.44576  ORF Transcript_37359/g.44576 Transcript_37359/m.44576 type:complete len:87 (-) Transcript_37359:1675-1935(-)
MIVFNTFYSEDNKSLFGKSHNCVLDINAIGPMCMPLTQVACFQYLYCFSLYMSPLRNKATETVLQERHMQQVGKLDFSYLLQLCIT